MRNDWVAVLLPLFLIYMPHQKSEMLHKYHSEKKYDILIFDSAATVCYNEVNSFCQNNDYCIYLFRFEVHKCTIYSICKLFHSLCGNMLSVRIIAEIIFSQQTGFWSDYRQVTWLKSEKTLDLFAERWPLPLWNFVRDHHQQGYAWLYYSSFFLKLNENMPIQYWRNTFRLFYWINAHTTPLQRCFWH